MGLNRRPLALPLGAVLLFVSCASARVEKKLDPKSREFVSKVRYIITSEERRAFLALTPEAREQFVEDFWKRRDPSPATAENEYKTEYFSRIEQANRLFSGGAAPGWLQDRGRIHITLGPPDYRETYPRGVTFYGVPTEIWWYGFFTMTFVDERWVDDYKLDSSSAAQIAVINRAQQEWNLPREGLPKGPQTGRAVGLPGLDLKIEKADGESTRFTLVIPYKSIWMKSRGDRFEATLEVTMKVADAAGSEAWTFTKAFPVDVPQGRLREVLARDFTAEAVAALGPGSYALTVTVTNATDGSRASLERKFEI
jgi:GWxTD domain-containing protein